MFELNFTHGATVYLQVCPVCAMRVGVDMVAHITLQHGSMFKISFSFLLLCVILFCHNQLCHSMQIFEYAIPFKIAFLWSLKNMLNDMV